MNSQECASEIIKAYPIKKFGDDTHVGFNWTIAELQKDEIISRFDTEILTMANLELYNFLENTDFLLVVGSRFGTMMILDNTDLLVPYKTYYLKTGIMFGVVGDKRSQFQFEVEALQNKKGVTILSQPEKVRAGGDLEKCYKICYGILETYFNSNSAKK